MDTEGFIRWALDDARTVDERYTVELLVEQGVTRWNMRRNIHRHESAEQSMERKRQRALNPAYQPQYSAESLRKACEVFPEFKSWSHYCSFDDRPVRDIKVFRFLPNIEDLQLNAAEVADIGVVAELPQLRKFSFSSRTCEDFRPLARCAQLRELHLVLNRDHVQPTTSWPDLLGLEQLTQLETLSLEGNLLAFQPGCTWGNVRRAVLKCRPLPVRSVRELPQLPACEFLTIAGVERLDGIEAFPRLRNLTIETDVRDFAPLESLTELTSLVCNGFEPLDLKPLTRLPKLYFVLFGAKFEFATRPVKTRDFSTLIDAPHLREVRVENCPPVMTEVAGLNAGLPSWNDLFLLDAPQALPPLRMIVAPASKAQGQRGIQRGAGEPELLDIELRKCEARWVKRFVTRHINETLGSSDWGDVEVNGEYRTFLINIESFGDVEKLPRFVEAARSAIAWLREDYEASFWIRLKAPKLKQTAAQKKLEEKLQEQQDDADFEQGRREREEYQERLHRYDLKKQDGQKIKPEEFAPGNPQPLPPPPWESEDDDDAGSEEGGVITKKKPDPEPSWFDDEHPLADNYRIMGRVTLSEVWLHGRGEKEVALAAYLMGRAPDETIPDDEKE